ncbi:MAG TPA: hypothetical protein PK904_07295 [Bacteroidales bacterium]|nr:hypothetical protein [Bacteroidales bacterium]
MSKKHTRSEIIQKALKDSDFKAKLLSNPKKTIEEETGEQFRDSVKVHIIQEDFNNIYYTIPNVVKDDIQDIPDGWFIKSDTGTEP